MKPWWIEQLDSYWIYTQLTTCDAGNWPEPYYLADIPDIDGSWCAMEQQWADSIGLGVNGMEGK